MRWLLALSLSLTVFLFCNTYSCLISMRSYCKFWNVLFLFLCSIWFHFFHLFHNLGWITKGHAFLKAHMPHPCVLLRIQGETKGPIPFFFFFKAFSIQRHRLHSPYTPLILTPLATNGLLKSENVLPLSGIYIIVWWGMIFLPFRNE